MAKIMLVEDDNNLREIYGARLLAEGHEIVAAKDGEEALAIAVKEKPDLIISDVMMPRISGFDMLDILRNAPETKETKVIMMTALSQAEDKARADQLGADRYLVKSQVTLEDVARVVKDVLEGKEESPDSAVPASNTTEAAPAPEAANPAPIALAEPVATPMAVAETPAAPEPTAAPQEVSASIPDLAPTPQPAATDNTTSTIPPLSDDNGTSTTIVNNPILPTAPVADEEDTSAQDPIQASVADAPAAEAVMQPTNEVQPSAPEPITATTEPAPTTPAPVATTSEPAPLATPTSAPVAIKVELPPETSSEPTETTSPPPEPTETPAAQASEGESTPFIGPNLTEALEKEQEAAAEEAATPVPTPESGPQSTPEPAIVNGVPELGVVQPSTSLPESEQEADSSIQEASTSAIGETTPSAAPAAESPASATPAEGSANPLDDEESKKKLVLQPINDPTKGPDLNALLEAEEAKAAVINPSAASVINPAIEAPAESTTTTVSPTQPAPTPTNEHDVISL